MVMMGGRHHFNYFQYAFHPHGDDAEWNIGGCGGGPSLLSERKRASAVHAPIPRPSFIHRMPSILSTGWPQKTFSTRWLTLSQQDG